jgi:hypothetical protein
MPIVSAFFGIVIRMFYRDHFHAEHARQQAKFDFGGELVAGEIRSGNARVRIREWAQQHHAELETNWANMKTGRPLESIEPLREGKS